MDLTSGSSGTRHTHTHSAFHGSPWYIGGVCQILRWSLGSNRDTQIFEWGPMHCSRRVITLETGEALLFRKWCEVQVWRNQDPEQGTTNTSLVANYIQKVQSSIPINHPCCCLIRVLSFRRRAYVLSKIYQFPTRKSVPWTVFGWLKILCTWLMTRKKMAVSATTHCDRCSVSFSDLTAFQFPNQDLSRSGIISTAHRRKEN